MSLRESLGSIRSWFAKGEALRGYARGLFEYFGGTRRLGFISHPLRKKDSL